jgi:hypothetical protein
MAKVWSGKKEKRKLQEFTGKIDYSIPYGFVLTSLLENPNAVEKLANVNQEYLLHLDLFG